MVETFKNRVVEGLEEMTERWLLC